MSHSAFVTLSSPIQILPIIRLTYRITILVLLFTPVALSYPLHLAHSYLACTPQLWWIRMLVNQLEQAGPLFIKLGQWASTRRDIFSDDTCDALTNLQSRITPHSIQHTRKVILAMYGKQIEEVFIEFCEDPVGVGAIAQVYRASLEDAYGSKTTVAVKIIHPGVREQVALDMQLIKLFGSALEYAPGMVYLGPRKEVDTFCDMMEHQLDLAVEASNLVRFRENFEGVRGVTFPRPIIEMSGSDVLVEEYHDGVLLSEWLAKGYSVFDEEIAAVGLNAFMMLLMDNFAHADLHAGNVILTLQKYTPASFFREKSIELISDEELGTLRASKNRDEWHEKLAEFESSGYEPKLILVDVGLISVLNEKSKKNLVDVVQAALQFDGYSIAELLISRSTHPHLVVNAEIGKQSMKALVSTVELDDSGRLPLSKIYSSNIMREFTRFVRDRRIHLDGDFVGLSVACLLIEGIGRKLNSDLDLMEAVSKYTQFD